MSLFLRQISWYLFSVFFPPPFYGLGDYRGNILKVLNKKKADVGSKVYNALLASNPHPRKREKEKHQ